MSFLFLRCVINTNEQTVYVLAVRDYSIYSCPRYSLTGLEDDSAVRLLVAELKAFETPFDAPFEDLVFCDG